MNKPSLITYTIALAVIFIAMFGFIATVVFGVLWFIIETILKFWWLWLLIGITSAISIKDYKILRRDNDEKEKQEDIY